MRILCKIWFETRAEMARISAIYFSRHCHRAIIFYIIAAATCATFYSSRQWCGGASAQHWWYLLWWLKICAVTDLMKIKVLLTFIYRMVSIVRTKDLGSLRCEEKNTARLYSSTVQLDCTALFWSFCSSASSSCAQRGITKRMIGRKWKNKEIQITGKGLWYMVHLQFFWRVIMI